MDAETGGVSDPLPTPDPEAIKRWARANAAGLDCGKIIIPSYLARELRKIGAWDDESMLESLPLPLVPHKRELKR
jgi:hypothetical protein